MDEVRHVLSGADVWIGACGGLVPILLTVYQWARTPKSQRPSSPFTDLGFWVLCVLLPLMGFFVVGLYEYFGTQVKGLLAFQVGATAPAFLQQLASASPPIAPSGKIG